MNGKPGWWIFYAVMLTTLAAALWECSSTTSSPENFYKEDCAHALNKQACRKQ